MSEAPLGQSTHHMVWADTMPPAQIEARTHPMPNLHDQDEVDHVIHSTFRQMGKPKGPEPQAVKPPSWRMSCCVKLLASLAGGYAFGATIVALSNF